MNLLTQIKNAWVSLTLSMMSEQTRLNYIETYEFSRGLRAKFAQSTPLLNDNQRWQVFEALRQYFVVCLKAHSAMTTMPSQIVDEAWHEFILFTQDYEEFCGRAFGHFLHHTPAAAMTSPTSAQNGIKRAWRLACRHEGINPRAPQRLPLLFAIDDQLNIEHGFIYTLDCMAEEQETQRKTYCATHIDPPSNVDVDRGSLYEVEVNAQAGEPVNAGTATNQGAHPMQHAHGTPGAHTTHSGHDIAHGTGHSTAGDAGASHSGHSCGGHSCGGHSCGGHGCGGSH